MTRAVLRKELIALWASPLPYVVGAAFHAILGILVVNQLEVRQQAVVQPLFPLAGFLLLFVVPILAMRAVAEEIRTGTLDLLLAVPVRTTPLVVGKWLAAWVTTLVVLAPAGLVVVLTHLWGQPDDGPAVAGFAGLTLLSAALAAVGLAVSAFTSSQPVAAMVTVFATLALWFANVGSTVISTGSALAAVSLSERLRTSAGGAIDTADVAYFISVTAVGLVIASLAIDLRRLR